MTSPNFDSRLTTRDTSYRLSRRKVVLGGVAAAAVVPLSGCGGAAAVVAFAPFFSFTFEGVVERKIVSVSFNPPSANQLSGRFDSSSSMNVRDPKNNNFSVRSTFEGSFNERQLQLTLANASPPLAAKYSGLFTEDRTIVLTPVLTPADARREPITLRLDHQTERFLPTLTGDWEGLDSTGAPWILRLETDPNSDAGNATVLLKGTEKRGLAPEVPLTGYASVRYIELDTVRAGIPVRLTGTLNPNATPPQQGVAQTTATITFDGADSGPLRRKP